MGKVVPFSGQGDGPPDLQALVQDVGTGGVSNMFGGFGWPARTQPTLLRRRKEKVTFVVRLDLDGAKPPIWRRLRLASDLSLAQLHDIVQVAMGWMDSHLHHFQMGPDHRDHRMAPFLTDYDLSEGETDGLEEADVRLDQVLAEPGHRLFYEYDFGDSWSHTIQLEKVEPWVDDAPAAVCVTGRRACPPEDVGGIHGYEEACAAFRGEQIGDSEWAEQILAWLPDDYDPEHFDADEVNDALQDRIMDLTAWHPALAVLVGRVHPAFSPIPALVGDVTDERVELSEDELRAVTRRYRVLLDVIGQGVQLTQAGYLPPAVVRELFDDLQLGNEWISSGTREDQTLPVLTLRESATALGLLRKQRSRLLITTAGRRLQDNPRGLFDHIRDRIPIGRGEATKDAGMLALLYAAAGEDFYDNREAAAEAMASLGWTSSGPLEMAVWHESAPTRTVLEHLTGRHASPTHSARIARALLAS